ncbi:MAG TPA: Ppx/GppA phosphatase family protein [Stellaceae bacterium]|nr:Ppx/GppA phosphatase family protein [Stellaceae bacterium]
MAPPRQNWVPSVSQPPSFPAVPPPLREGRADICAALDLGTNNCRLLVARRRGDGFHVIDAFSRIVRLGEGLAASGRLSDAAMNRTIAALRICAAKVARSSAGRARYVATEACRRATNCGEFVERVRRDTGIRMEIISSDEEVRLVVAGCAPLLDLRMPYALVFDIGGGSTELAWLALGGGAPEAAALVGFVSLPHGVVTLADRYGGHDVSAATYAAMVAELRVALAPFEAKHAIATQAEAGRMQLLGSSGTVTTLAGVHLDLPRYDRNRVDGSVLGFDHILGASRRLATLTWDERAAHPCIGPERADLVLAGCAILEAICLAWPVGSLVVADRGVREGILQGFFGGVCG